MVGYDAAGVVVEAGRETRLLKPFDRVADMGRDLRCPRRDPRKRARP